MDRAIVAHAGGDVDRTVVAHAGSAVARTERDTVGIAAARLACARRAAGVVVSGDGR